MDGVAVCERLEPADPVNLDLVDELRPELIGVAERDDDAVAHEAAGAMVARSTPSNVQLTL